MLAMLVQSRTMLHLASGSASSKDLMLSISLSRTSRSDPVGGTRSTLLCKDATPMNHAHHLQSANDDKAIQIDLLGLSTALELPAQILRRVRQVKNSPGCHPTSTHHPLSSSSFHSLRSHHPSHPTFFLIPLYADAMLKNWKNWIRFSW
jgi:hypothetical protein